MVGVGKKPLFVAAILATATVLLLLAVLASFYFSMISHVQTKASFDGRYAAKLYRHQGIDVNFNLTVDGVSVYYSPDFAPVKEDFREHIAWDVRGESIVLFVAGQRLFGYQSREKRSLTAKELLDVRFAPFERLGFEGRPSNVSPAD